MSVHERHLLDCPAFRVLEALSLADGRTRNRDAHRRCRKLVRVPAGPLAGATVGACSLSELLDSDGSVLLDDEHAAALRDRLDDLACETENGGLVRRAVADDERATAVGE